MSSKSTMYKRVFLWTAPRSLSTAFFFSIGTLPDVKLFYEPYIVPFCKQNSQYCFFSGSPLDYSYEEADKMIQAEYPSRNAVFVKEFAFRIQSRYEVFLDEAFQGFAHTFLIRNPQRAIPSYNSANPKAFTQIYGSPGGDNPYIILSEFYDFLKDRLGIDPLIIDADDLLANPDRIMEAYCDRVGLIYKEGMTKWEPRTVPVGFKEQTAFLPDVWFETVLKSSGFNIKQTPLPTQTDDIPPVVRECIDECLVPYNKMYSSRMTI